MPRRLIKRYLPDHRTIREHKHLRWIGEWLHDPNLWHLNRRSVSGAFSVGLFMAFVPVPFQMVLAALGAVALRVNLPISVALVWVSNPFTMPAMFWFCYQVGTWLLGRPERQVQFQLSWEWLSTTMLAIWQPFLLGCLVVGIVASIVGNIAVRVFWRLNVAAHHRRRRRDRLAREGR